MIKVKNIRSRKILTGRVVAPNQVGIGLGKVKTYGHSLIINPMGEIMAEANDSDEAIITSVIDASFKVSFTLDKNK